jgi:hypothetical protein
MSGVVDFENINEIKKKSVRGLLKKRARKYYESDHSSDEEVKVEKKKKTVQKSSLSAAFKSIMNKTIVEPKDEMMPVDE